MKKGNWHGENAAVLHEDEFSVMFLIGKYEPSEFERIKQGIDNEDPEICEEYGDWILEVDREEWEEQQS